MNVGDHLSLNNIYSFDYISTYTLCRFNDNGLNIYNGQMNKQSIEKDVLTGTVFRNICARNMEMECHI